MKEEQHQFLTLLGQLPARLTAEQVAWVLNCQPHDVPILVASRLLKPLGNPAPNAIKFFATADLLELLKDRSWLAKMTSVIGQHWQRKNTRGKTLLAKDHGLREISLTRSANQPQAETIMRHQLE